MAKTRGSGSVKQKQGKNKKKTWKQIQHGDVDKFLDEVRQDERHGGIKSKPDEDIFAIDDLSFHASDWRAEDKVPATPTGKIERNDTGPLIRTEDLKCFRLLKPHTSVSDPVIKRNPIKKRGARKALLMRLKDDKRLSKKKVDPVVSEEKCQDPWAMVEKKTVLDSEWIDSNIKRVNLRPRVAKPKKNITSELPAVEAPHPGFSYNPSFQDHQDLLQEAVTATARSIRKEKNLIKAIAPTKSATVSKAESESDDEESVKFEMEDVKPHIQPKSKAKTKQQKRKEREEKEKIRRLQEKKQDNARLNEVFRIKTIQKEIKSTEKKQKERLAKLIQKNITREKYGQKKLSKFKYEELALDPALSEEIQGSLLSVPSHNRLILERFNSLQKRNILEPRVKQRVHRKLRVKKFQKAVEKMDWEKTGYWNGIKLPK